MYQIDNSTAATTQPASTAAGTAGFFTDGNPATSTPATIVPAEWLNAVMMELVNVITGAGLTLSKSSFNQVITAIKTLMQRSAPSLAVDTGSANAYVVAFNPALTSPPAFVPLWFSVKTANTGPSTLNATGTPYTLVGEAHAPLQGGELVANGQALVYWNPYLNSGGGQWVLVFCTGAASQLAGGSYGVTPAQFDNGANLATTAFAKSAGFRHAASVQLSASTTLSVAHAGKVVVLAGTGGYTITLPNRANYPDGESITLVCTASSPITVQRQGTDSIYPNNAPITSFTMANGDTAVIESSAAVTGWNVLGGSVQLGYAGAFGSSLAGSGYQKLPSGLILQWGTGTGGTALSFPLAFPNGLYGITVQIADASVAETGYTSASVNGFTPKTYNTSGSAITAAVFWMAIGK